MPSLEARMIAADAEVKHLEDKLSIAKARRTDIGEEIMEKWAEEGIDQVKIAGAGTVYLNRRVVAKKLKDDAAVYAALRASGHGALIKDNVPAQTLASTVREEIEANDELPPEWDGIIEAAYIPSIRVRKS